MIQMDIPGALRSAHGKGDVRRLRSNNITPAVVYSSGDEALSLQFDTAVLYKGLFEIHGRNAVVTLKVDGDAKGERHVLVKEIQKNPVTDRLVHVDFHEIDLNKPSYFKVPLKYTGTAKGVDFGGDLNVLKTSVQLKGCPLDIPDYIDVDITGLDRGDGLTYGDITAPDNVEMLDKSETVCVSVS